MDVCLNRAQLDRIRLRLGSGDSCVRVEAQRLKLSPAALKRLLYDQSAVARPRPQQRRPR